MASVLVGIIGLGHVGRLTRTALAISADIVGYDLNDAQAYPLDQLAACQYVVICVNTPENIDGSADLSQVRSALRQLPRACPVVLRSTVPPGSTAALSAEFGREIYFWPEYLGESRFAASTWETLSLKDPFLVIGGEKSSAFTAWIDFLAQNYGPLTRIYRCSSTEAELVKYMENCYFAVKTTFVNEFRSLTESMGQDWQQVREGWLLDPRVDRDHSDAFAAAPGFSGKCLPKDSAALVAAARTAGLELPLMETVLMVNQRIRTSD